jgi:hypothetical protein
MTADYRVARDAVALLALVFAQDPDADGTTIDYDPTIRSITAGMDRDQLLALIRVLLGHAWWMMASLHDAGLDVQQLLKELGLDYAEDPE